MDHLHEELKQPIMVSNDDEVAANNSNQKSLPEFARHCVTAPIDCDTSDPSDTDYETCDSGLSSESNSVAADMSPRTNDVSDDTLVQQSSTEQSTSTNDCIDSAVTTNCDDAEVVLPPTVSVGDALNADGFECAGAQCQPKSEAGAGEIGTVTTEERSVTDLPTCSTDSAMSDTTSVLSTLSDSKCVRDSVDATSQVAELAATLDTHLTLGRKSSPRERPQSESVDKLARPMRTSGDTTVQKKRKSGHRIVWMYDCAIS